MDDNRDKETMRNQTIGIILMMVLLFAWFKWFMPQPQPRRPEPTPPTTQTQARPEGEEPGQEAPSPNGAAQAEPWAGLPEAPTITDPASEEVVLGDEHLDLVFTRIGGRLKRASVIVDQNGEDTVALVPATDAADTEAVYPLGLRFTDPGLGSALDRRRFEVERDPEGRAVTFSLTVPGKAVIRKRFSLGDAPYVMEARIEYENASGEQQIVGLDQTPAYYLCWEPNLSASVAKSRYVSQSLMWLEGDLIDELATAKMKPKDGRVFSMKIPAPLWTAIKNPYFVMAARPDFEGSDTWATGNAERFRIALSAPRFAVEPGGVQAHAYTLYLGPSEQSAMAEAWPTLGGVLRFFTPRWAVMDWFAKFLLRILNFFHHNVIANYGLAIIFLTVVVRMAMYPLTLKSMRSMKKMQLLGPEMEALKAKYGEDPQELNKRMMEMYKERGVNPLGGCLPIALQMPIFITLYRMLMKTYELRGAPFVFWITDLSQPDRLLHMPWMKDIPFVGETFAYLNVLPILMGLAMVLNSKMMPSTAAAQNPQQKMMMTIMPVFFCFVCYNMAAGLNLYILTSTVLGMVQQKFTRVSDVDAKPKKRKTPAKKQHFYTAAQARKRQMEKDAKKVRKERRDKKRKS